MKGKRFDPGPSPFVAGADVAVIDHDGVIRKRQVGKVYKNGNFTLAVKDPPRGDRPDQWRQYGDRACLVGQGKWGRSSCHPWTPKLAEEATRQAWARRHKHLCRTLSTLFASPAVLDAGFVEDICEIVAAKAVAGFCGEYFTFPRKPGKLTIADPIPGPTSGRAASRR